MSQTGRLPACVLLIGLALWGACDDASTEAGGQWASMRLAPHFAPHTTEEGGHHELAWLVDRLHVLVQDENRNLVVNHQVDWPAESASIELGPFSLPLDSAVAYFQVEIRAFAGSQLLFGFGPELVEVAKGVLIEVPAALRYTGTGSTAAQVRIHSQATAPRAGDSFMVYAEFLDAEQEPVDADPRLVHWVSLDPEAAIVTGSGLVTVLDAVGRTAAITAEIAYLNLPVDTLTFVVVGAEPETDQLLLELDGVFHGVWHGGAVQFEVLGKPEDTHSMIFGAPDLDEDFYFWHDSMVVFAVPAEIQVGSYTLGAFDPLSWGFVGEPAGAFYAEYTWDEIAGSEHQKLYASTTGELTISEILPGDPDAGDMDRLIGEVFMEARAYDVSWFQGDDEPTVTELDETITVRASFHIRRFVDVEGSLTGTIAGPFPVVLDGWADGWIEEERLHVSGGSYSDNDAPRAHMSLSLPLGPDPLGSYVLGDGEDVQFSISISVDGHWYSSLEPQEMWGTIQLVEYSPPTLEDNGIAVLTVSAEVPLYDHSTWDVVGLAVVEATIHAILWHDDYW